MLRTSNPTWGLPRTFEPAPIPDAAEEVEATLTASLGASVMRRLTERRAPSTAPGRNLDSVKGGRLRAICCIWMEVAAAKGENVARAWFHSRNLHLRNTTPWCR